MLINVKMPTIVGILTFMSWINFVLSCVEYEKVLYSRGQVWTEVHVLEILTCDTGLDKQNF